MKYRICLAILGELYFSLAALRQNRNRKAQNPISFSYWQMTWATEIWAVMARS